MEAGKPLTTQAASAQRVPPKRQAHCLWAVLIARIYEVFPLLCPLCGEQMRIIAFMERDLTQFCAVRKLTKSQVVQEALAEYMVAAQAPPHARAVPDPDLSFLAPDDPIRQFIGIAKDGMSTDELMRMTRGDDWNQP